MRCVALALAVALLACGTDLDAPEDCAAGELHYIYGSTDARLPIGNLAFINVFGSNTVGKLELGVAGADHVLVEFNRLVADGEIVSARGRVMLTAGIDAGNCETGPYNGLIQVGTDGGSWRFDLRELHAPPYCSGAAIAEPFSACYRKAN